MRKRRSGLFYVSKVADAAINITVTGSPAGCFLLLNNTFKMTRCGYYSFLPEEFSATETC